MRLWSLPLVALIASHALTFAPLSASAQAPVGATVSGVVRDSVARVPLIAAVVQLAAADSLGRFGRSAVTDSLGRFAITDVPNGRYTLGFIHPVLDSLGLEPLLREVLVDGQRTVRVDLAVPSPARLRVAICGKGPADSGGVVVGFVRDAQDRAPIAAVPVTGEWLELAFTAQGVLRRTPRVTATTGDNGWFALCNVPSTGTMWLFTGRGADSTGRIEVQIPVEGFVRRELHLGAARDLVRLTGTVVAAAGRRPIAGALVSVAGGSEIRTDARGEWTLVDVAAGTRMLEVRAVGYYPERRSTEVVAGAAPAHFALPTLQSVLDTVNIRATRLDDRNLQGFEERRRGSGVGRYLTPADIARRNPFRTSDLFRTVLGVSLDQDYIRMRGAFGQCSPSLYVDGTLIPVVNGQLMADDVDIWSRPDNIAGIEIYTEAQSQFQQALSGCGSIVIWTRPPKVSFTRTSWKFRAVQGLGIAALVLVTVALID